MPAFQVPSVFSAVDRITAPMRKMSAGVMSFARTSQFAIAKTERVFVKFFRSVNMLAGGFGILFGTALAANAVSQGLDTIATFEQGLIGVGKTADISGPKLTKLGMDVIQLSRSMRSVVGTERLLELATTAGQLGVKGSENILKFSKVMAMMETSTDIAGSEGAASLARILNITREGIGTIDKFASSLVALGNDTAAAESEIVEVATEVARATSSFRLSGPAILGISASLKSVGVQAQAGGSAVGKFFKQMEKAVFTGKNLDKFAKVTGKSQDEVKALFKQNPASLFVPFIQGLSKVSKEGGSVNQVLESLGIAGEIAFKGLAPMAIAAEITQKSMKLAAEEYEKNTALNKEFAAASKSLRSAMSAVVNEFTNIINSTSESTGTTKFLAKAFFLLRDNLGFVIKTTVILIGSYLALKIITAAIRIATIGYNVVLGITAALQGKSAFAVRANTVALKTQLIVTKLATAAQWLWNAALAANPIGLIIIAITALIALIVLMVRKWDEGGASLALFTGAMGPLISIIQSFRRNWDLIVKSFEEGGIIRAIRAIGLTFIDAVIQPVEQFLKTMESFIPGLSRITPSLESARRMIALRLEGLAGVTPTGEVRTNRTASPEAAVTNVERSESSEERKVSVVIQDSSGNAMIDDTNTSPDLDVKVVRGFNFAF